MKPIFPLFLGVCLVVAVANGKPAGDLTSCKCWEGYEPSNSADGPECVGTMLLHSMPCNEPQPPQCKCSGNVTGILKDQTGIWCSAYKAGKEIKRWECENKEDWTKFYEQNPDYKP